ncbi:cupin domain-containing protein, partial [Dokdonella sp.]|uniref:cupin domain-containing protein n=1 Tax=Dokdonella sp. TaxID=2291710 RepID=UPI002F3F0AAE
MSAETFLRDYWQKHPLLVRAAFPNFVNPVAPDDLAGLACEELALSRIVIRQPHDDGPSAARRRTAQAEWTLRSGPFDEGHFAKLPATHWTLLVQDVDKWDADVCALLDAFAFLPRWRIDDVMVSYAEDGGSVGAHVDQYDVFLLQGLGRRRWEISTDPAAPLAFRDDVELKLLAEFAPTHGWVLEPGDMLYLPPRVPHHGVALGACMTYSIGMRAPSQADLLGDFIDHLIETLPEEARYTDADLAPARGDGEIDDAAIARVARAMPWLRIDDAGIADARARPGHERSHASRNAVPGERGRKREVDGGPGRVPVSSLRTWFGRFITRYRSAHVAAAPPRRLGDAAFMRAAAAGASVRRNPWSRCAWMRDGRGARLFVAGEAYPCSLALARALGGDR